MDDKKSKERLKKFQTQKNPAKKWKSMRKFLEKEPADILKQFWKTNADEILGCIVAYAGVLETTKETDKAKKPYEQDVVDLFKTLQQTFEQLRTLIVGKWKHKDLSALLTKGLARQNKPSIRKSAFEMLCSYIEMLLEAGGGVELEEMIRLLKQSINLHVFIPEVPGASAASIKESVPTVAANLVLAPYQGEPTTADSAELLDTLFVFMGAATAPGKPPSLFQFWFTTIKVSYLVYFYPDIWKKIGLMDLAEAHGFSFCPPSVQAVIINRFDVWKDNQAFIDVLWEENNAPFAMEVLRQCCELSMNHAESIAKCIQTFKQHLLFKRPDAINELALQAYWKDLASYTSKVFVLDSTPGQQEVHSKLISLILPIYDYLSLKTASLLANDTWKSLQYTLLETTMNFLRKNQANMLNDSKNDIVRNADELIAQLFAVWIRSPMTTPEMWKDFHKYFASTLEWPHSIRQWRFTMIKLTTILCQFIYTNLPVQIVVSERSRRDTTIKQPSVSDLTSTGGQKDESAEATTSQQDGVPTTNSDATSSTSKITTPRAEPSVPQSPRTMVQIDVSIEELGTKYLGVSNWTKESIKAMWFTILEIVGNINEIRSALNFELAMRCISDVVSMLLEAEKDLLLSENPRRINPIEVFFPCLMEACYATGEKIRGVIITFQILCQLFCTQHPTPLPTELWAHFYRAIQVGLKSDNPVVRDQIITEAKHIFSYNLPGVAILIPDLLTEITSIFKSRAAAPEVQKHAITLFNSLLCYSNHFKGINIPDMAKINQQAQMAALQQGTTQEHVITSNELRDTMASLLTSLLNNPMDPNAKGHNLWGACIMLFEETANEAPRMGTVTSCLQAILYLTRHHHDGVAINAANVLYALSDLFDAFNSLDKNLTYSMIGLICESIAALLNVGNQGTYRENVISALFEALTAWVVAGPNDFLRDRNLATKVFNVVEIGLYGQPVEPSKLAQPSITKIVNDEDYLTSPALHLVTQLRDRPSHSSLAIKNAAETTLYTILELYNNWPTPAGATSLDSTLSEIPELPAAFFINNHEQLFSFQILTRPDAKKEDSFTTDSALLRTIVRDSMGKHVWDITLDYDQHPDRPNYPLFEDPVPTGPQPPAPEVVPRKTDLLATLLNKYDEKHLDCLPQTPKFIKFTCPPVPDASYKDEIETIKAAIVSSCENDAKLWNEYQEQRPESMVMKLDSSEPVSHMSLARLALSHLGYTSPMSRRNFHLIQDSPTFRKKLEHLDTLSAREQHSFLVRYLSSGYDEKNAASPPSRLFSNFISGLGWSVDLETHRGFKGTLTADACKTATYFSNATTELVYELEHELSNEARKQARDAAVVELVWCEHKRDYSPVFCRSGAPSAPVTNSPMTSRASVSVSTALLPSVSAPPVSSLCGADVSFGVYPLSSGQFRIASLKRDPQSIGLIGPLLHGMVVSKNILAPLARLSASAARRRAVVLRQGEYKHPRIVRMTAIRQISQDFRAPKAGELFHSHLFPLGSYPELSMCVRPKSGVLQPVVGVSYVPAIFDASKEATDATDSTSNISPSKPKHVVQRSYGVSRSAGTGKNHSMLDLSRKYSVSHVPGELQRTTSQSSPRGLNGSVSLPKINEAESSTHLQSSPHHSPRAADTGNLDTKPEIDASPSFDNDMAFQSVPMALVAEASPFDDVSVATSDIQVGDATNQEKKDEHVTTIEEAKDQKQEDHKEQDQHQEPQKQEAQHQEPQHQESQHQEAPNTQTEPVSESSVSVAPQPNPPSQPSSPQISQSSSSSTPASSAKLAAGFNANRPPAASMAGGPRPTNVPQHRPSLATPPKGVVPAPSGLVGPKQAGPGGPSKLPSGFKVPFGVGGAFKMPGTPKQPVTAPPEIDADLPPPPPPEE